VHQPALADSDFVSKEIALCARIRGLKVLPANGLPQDPSRPAGERKLEFNIYGAVPLRLGLEMSGAILPQLQPRGWTSRYGLSPYITLGKENVYTKEGRLLLELITAFIMPR
jgi:hypothetical protein